MKKIDWYILKKFILTFFFAIFLFTVIAIVVDISEKADDFVKSHLGVKNIILQYYIAFVPYMAALLFPLFVFIAVIFFTSKMAVRSEIIAILASGASFNRWLRPYLIGGVFLAGLLWYANHYLVPRSNQVRGAFETKYFDPNSSYEAINRMNGGSNNIYLKVDSFSYASLGNYDTASKRGQPFFMYRIKNNVVVENLRASDIFWDTATKKWRMNYVVKHDFNGMHEKVVFYQSQNTDFNFRPSDLKTDKYTKDKLESPDLRRQINLEEMRGSEGLNELKVEMGRRDATPVTVILLTLIGAIVAGRKVRGGSGLHLAMGLIIAALFILADKFSTVFSTKGNFPPILAAWTPNIIFVFVVIALYRRAPK